MEIKETQDLWVLRERSRLRIPDVKNSAAKYAVTIDEQIMEAGLEIDGPYLFISHNLPKDSKTFFDWEICRPVKKTERYEGKLELAHLEPIMVASKVHQGSLRTLFTKGYASLIAELDMSRYIYSGESREIYHGWSGPGASYHNIEIQFGLAR
ncbi:hypothetical protein OF122_10195 [Pelagibacterium flavum]|uniref:GyrI-like small molecule binding domain-containing protein n=1 Tax=Pelagibacterium flavum TaxID=2984530 RepID=A0ABY6IIN4_9HYPH|nr:hypothetical protein [Pelagibacterium sp. YIM 151497]UYQ70457.1 hypothetical protein OF122_10195 [Pelagibacterium sp. YIM 151497]|tara:strand:- start:863 stop:1321 length:459 start_codon:yes stop_codon:yes gene_type:complete